MAVKIKYPLTWNPILEYWEAIESGQEIVSLKVRKTYEHLVNKLTDTSDGYFYSPKRANHIIEFAENYCHHSKGKLGGQRVQLELWEKALLAAVFGFIDIEGLRQYREALLIVGKKNGKSLLASIVGNYMLVADGEPGPEVYAVATKRDQAKFSGLHFHILGRPQIDPVGLSVNVLKLLNIIIKIFNAYFFHDSVSLLNDLFYALPDKWACLLIITHVRKACHA